MRRGSAAVPIAMLALGLSGCAAPSVSPPVEPSVAPSVAQSVEPAGDGTGVSAAPVVSTDAGMSDAELAAALEAAPPGPPRSNAEMLEQLWEQLRLEGEPPVVEPVRTITVEEWQVVYHDCMAELGFPSTVDQHGQQGISFDRAHEDDMGRASYTCTARYPLDEARMQPFDLAQLRLLYDWRVEETIPCIAAAGITPPEPPSFESFVARYAATGYEHWSPIGEIDMPPDAPEGWCPDTPPDEILYGDR